SVLEMFDQRLRPPLDQYVDRVNSRIDHVGKHEVDDPVLSAERYRRLGAIPGQRMEPRALPSSHDKRKCSHGNETLSSFVIPLETCARQKYRLRPRPPKALLKRSYQWTTMNRERFYFSKNCRNFCARLQVTMMGKR